MSYFSSPAIIQTNSSLRSKTHKRLKERFLIRRNRTKRANLQIFEVILFSKLRTLQQKTVKPTYLCPLDARKLAERKDSERWQSTLFQIFFLNSNLALEVVQKYVHR